MFDPKLSESDENEIKACWEKIGLTESEQISEQQKVQNQMMKIISQYKQTTLSECSRLQNEISETTKKHAQLMRSFGINESEITDIYQYDGTGTLREQLSTVSSAYNEFRSKCQKKIDKFEELQRVVTSLYDQLNISVENRGEFAELGELDFTKDRASRYNEEISHLREEIQRRQSLVESTVALIQDLSKQLEVSMPELAISIMNSPKINDKTINDLNNCLADLQKMKSMRVEEIHNLRTVVMKLWAMLGTPKPIRERFTNSFKTFGATVIQSYNEEIARLLQQRIAKLPEIVEKQKNEIKRLYDEMHYETQPSFPSKGDLNAVYEELEQRIEGLKEQYQEMKPLIDQINQRVDLLNESEQNQADLAKIEHLQTKKKDIDPKFLHQVEQSRRHVKSILPRCEKKLLMALIEYKANHGHDFMWDGQEYVNSLTHIKLSEDEIKRAQGKVKRKKSLADTRKERFSYFGISTEKVCVSRRSLANRTYADEFNAETEMM